MLGSALTPNCCTQPETRAYELIEEYEPVGDVEEVRAIMRAHIPATPPAVPPGEDPDFWLPVEYPNIPRKALHTEVLEMNVFGIDQATVAEVLSVLAEVLDETEQVRAYLRCTPCAVLCSFC